MQHKKKLINKVQQSKENRLNGDDCCMKTITKEYAFSILFAIKEIIMKNNSPCANLTWKQSWKMVLSSLSKPEKYEETCMGGSNSK